MTLRALAAAILAAAPLGACATAPKPCTTEWIGERTDQILTRFALENRDLVSDLRELVREGGKIDTVQAILLAAKTDELRDFADSFESYVIPDLKSSIGQCGSDADFVPAFTDFLRREGVSEEALEWAGPVLALSKAIEAGQ